MDKYSQQILAHNIVDFVDNIQGQWHDTNDPQNT